MQHLKIVFENNSNLCKSTWQLVPIKAETKKKCLFLHRLLICFVGLNETKIILVQRMSNSFFLYDVAKKNSPFNKIFRLYS